MSLNTKGSGLIGMLIALAALGFISSVILTSANLGFQSVTDTKLQSQAVSLVNEVRSYLAGQVVCKLNYQGLTLTPGVAQPPNGMKIVDSTSTTLITLGTPRPNEQVTLVEASLTGFVVYDSADPKLGYSNLRIGVKYPNAKVSVWTAPISVVIDTATNTLQECQVTSWKKPVWDESTGYLSYFGNVGIGTPPNSDALAVQGVMQAQFSPGRSIQIIPDPTGIEIWSANGGGYFAFGGPTPYGGALLLNYFGGASIGSPSTSTGSSVLFLRDGANTVKMLKFETTDALQNWSVTLSRDYVPSGDANPNGLRFKPNDATKQAMIFESRLVIGDTNGGSTDFWVDGKAGGTTTWLPLSDERFKKDIKDLPDTMPRLRKATGVSFRWRKSDQPSIGFIAQNLAKPFPSLVDKGGPFQTVRYTEMIPVLTRALQSLLHRADKVTKDRLWIVRSLCSKYPSDPACQNVQINKASL